MLQLQQEAQAAGVELRGWRSYPKRDRALTFSLQLNDDMSRGKLALSDPTADASG